ADFVVARRMMRLAMRLKPFSVSPRRRRAGAGASSSARAKILPALRNSCRIVLVIVRFLLGPAKSLSAGLVSFALAPVIVVAPSFFVGIAYRRRAILRDEILLLLSLPSPLIDGLFDPLGLFLPYGLTVTHLLGNLRRLVRC